MRLVAITAVVVLMPFRPVGMAAQVPAGFPFEPGVHPNPIVTFATSSDFRDVSYEAAREESGIELLGLSARVGVREELGLAASEVREVELLDRDTDVLFFPAVRQRFRLNDDRMVTLYSFRNPRPGEVPQDVLAEVLNQHAFRPGQKAAEARFGPHPGPEELSIRGVSALLFEAHEESPLTLFWQHDGVSHVATSDTLDREELFRVVADFL